MCGVFAVLSDPRRPSFVSADARILAAKQAHRGPDGAAFSVLSQSGSLALTRNIPARARGAFGILGHQRLSIIDLSDGASQPFLGADGEVALSFNGEIYNYVELRSELADRGCRFLTTSDTEVLLQAYLTWGTDCFRRLNGDFAILIYDRRRGRLVGARDRLGIKPLFFASLPGRLVLASEMKALCALPAVWRTDAEAAYRYLAADFPIPGEVDRTFVESVRSVLPGHWFEADPGKSGIRQHRYWSVEEAPRSAPKGDAADGFFALLQDSVRIRMRADVPLGSFLSGGLDSSSITALAAKEKPGLRTFSASFPGTSVDEGPAIRSLSRQLGVANEMHLFRASHFADELERLVYLQDQPFQTLNVYSQFKVIEFAKKARMKVVLDGGGSDELLGGYGDYLLPAAADSGERTRGVVEFLKETPAALARKRTAASAAARRVPYIAASLRAAAGRDAKAVDRPFPAGYKGRWRGSYLKHALRDSLVSSWMNKCLWWDNRYLDLSGMAVGVEIRVPFQDHRLVEYALSLEPSDLVRKGKTKAVLRDAVRGLLPASIVDNPRKIGFEFPFCDMLRKDRAVRGLFGDIVASRAFRRSPYVDPAQVSAELEAIRAGRSSNYNIWRAFNLHLWTERMKLSSS